MGESSDSKLQRTFRLIASKETERDAIKDEIFRLTSTFDMYHARSMVVSGDPSSSLGIKLRTFDSLSLDIDRLRQECATLELEAIEIYSRSLDTSTKRLVSGIDHMNEGIGRLNSATERLVLLSKKLEYLTIALIALAVFAFEAPVIIDLAGNIESNLSVIVGLVLATILATSLIVVFALRLGDSNKDTTDPGTLES